MSGTKASSDDKAAGSKDKNVMFSARCVTILEKVRNEYIRN